MLRQGLILTTQREYAQVMRQALLKIGNEQTRVDIELDALRAMQLIPQQYDLILLDILLDSMDGLQLLVLMKQQAPGTKFIIISDSADEISRAQAYQNGADYFLQRPVDGVALTFAIESISNLIKPDADGKLSLEDKDGPLTKIADMVQTHCLSGDSVLLLVRAKQQSGDVFIYRGEVYHAQYPGKGGEKAFHDMMHWDDGLLRVKALKLTHVPPRTIELPYQQLLDTAETFGAPGIDIDPPSGGFLAVSADIPSEGNIPTVVQEAPPREDLESTPVADSTQLPRLAAEGETPLPQVNSHWKISLTGELVEGSQISEPDRCSFITYFIYRKMADVAVALEVDYFNELLLQGPHIEQVLVANNMGVRHAVFDAAWTDEATRAQYIKWCCEQSF